MTLKAATSFGLQRSESLKEAPESPSADGRRPVGHGGPAVVAAPGKGQGRRELKSGASERGAAEESRAAPTLLPLPKRMRSPERVPLTRSAPAVKPEDSTTWPARIQTAWRCVSKNGSMPRAKLEELLKLAGHRSVWMELLDIICEDVSTSHAFSTAQAYQLVSQYEARIQQDLKRAFKKRALADGNLAFHRLEELTFELGYTPVPNTITEVASEAAQATGEPLQDEDHVTLPVFEKYVELLVEREGFSQSEALALEQAFRRFDRDGSGNIDADELHCMLIWLGFCADMKIVMELVEDVKDTALGIDLERFMILMRKHRAAEYAHTLELFDRFDSDLDGLLSPGELSGLFRRLGLSLVPEALIEVVQECNLNYEEFTFTDFWKALQVLRNREGFTAAERKDIAETFQRFDRSKTGEISTRSAGDALRWLGYLQGRRERRRMEWRREYGQRGRLTEEEFVKIVREHAEGQLHRTRFVFREMADERGAGPLPFSRLADALKELTWGYQDEHEKWLRANMPHKWMLRNTTGFDFEEFRRVAEGCHRRMRDRLRAHQGFTDRDLAELRISFAAECVKHGGSKTLPPAGLVELFPIICPVIETSPEVRNTIKKAMSMHKVGSGGLDWDGLVQVMRTYEDLLEEEEAAGAPLVKSELGVPATQIDDVLDIFHQYLLVGPRHLSFDDMRMLYHAGTPQASKPEGHRSRLTDDMAEVLREHLLQMQAHHGAAGTVEKFVKFAKELRATDPETLGMEAWQHDAEGSLAQGGGHSSPARSWESGSPGGHLSSRGHTN